MANMVTTYNWLQEFAPFSMPVQELSSVLTNIGIEVEEIRPIGGSIEGVVVGLVEKKEAHPNADRLSLCQVNTGQATLKVVCGAPNVARGQKIAFATPGTLLPGGLKIGQRNIRGQDSSGMICSEAELGLADQADGILVLPEDSELGTPYPKSGKADHLLVLEITPNRPDLLSVRGMARDICASLSLVPTTPAASTAQLALAAKGKTSVKIDKPELCPRYAGLIIRKVKVAPSPDWLAARLKAIGQRPISNIVDATNLALFETGHPLHAFDLAKLVGGRIEVRPARKKECLTTLDGVARELEPDMLVIADGEKPVALAGIMGGADSEVSEATQDILLECATFNPQCIRRTARALSLTSEASLRFSRGVDAAGTQAALERTAEIILETAGGSVEGPATDNYPSPTQPARVEFSPAGCTRLLGIEVERKEMKRRLTALGLEWQDGDSEAVLLSIPSHRPDLSRQADISEEIARLGGYDSLQPTLPRGPLPVALLRNPAPLRQALRSCLRHRGYQEVILPSLEPGGSETDSLPLLNPLTEEMARLRRSPLPALLALLARQLRLRPSGLRLFEFTRLFSKRGNDNSQESVLAGICCGTRDLSSWSGDSTKLDVFDIKGLVIGLLSELHATAIKIMPGGELDGLQANNTVTIRQKKQAVAILGQVHPSHTSPHKQLDDDVFYFEVYPERLKLSAAGDQLYHSFSRYPAVTRDIALLVPETVPSEKVVSAIRKTGGDFMTGAQLFDYYHGKQVAEGNYSISLHLTYQAQQETLTDELVDTAYQAMVSALAKDLSVTVRER